MTKNIWIIWSWGAVWVQLEKLLQQHPEFSSTFSTTPSWLSQLDTNSWAHAIKDILSENEVVILAVHDSVAESIMWVKENIGWISKIIDCSTAHRVNPNWVYWLPEIEWRRWELETAPLIANPGCHSSAIILGISPLKNTELINESSNTVMHSITGYSWWGKGMVLDYEQAWNIAPLQYCTWIEHKHESEIKVHTWLRNVIFQPEVVNYFNGLKTNVFLQLTQKWKQLSQNDFIEIFTQYYLWKKFINVAEVPKSWKVDMSENNWTQNVTIYIKKHLDTFQVVTVLDNMMKWAAGAVVQNLNIIYWLDENEWF